MNSKLKKMVEAAVISGTLVAAIVSAQAQSASTGHTAVVSGAGAKGAYADQVNVSAEDGNLTISGGAAGGVRVGDTKIQIGIEGAASAPLPTPSNPVPVPTLAQAAAPIVAPIAAPVSVAKRILGL